MARRWGNGPIDVKVGRGGSQSIKLPSFSQLRLILLGIAALALLWTGYYQIQPEEVGIIQRFGRYARTTQPGPHIKLPFGIETLTRVPVQRQLKMEFGFRTVEAGIRTEYVGGGDLAAEAVMLTGDLNVGVVEWIVQYRISDPYAWLFNVRSPVETFRYTSEAAMRQVVGDHSVDEVLTTGREDIARQARDELQRLCELYGLGIEVQQLVLQNVNPPDPVKPAFNEVNQAIQEKERSINEAWAEYNQAVPRAQGEAEQMIRAAEGYALERVNRAQGDASRFDAVYAEFRKSPDVTRRRLYLEAMGRLLPRLGRKVILDENARGVLPLLQLDGPRREVQQ